jgi:hypothetical protein
MATLVRDAALRARLGSAAKARVLPRFGVDGYLSSVTKLYDQLLIEKHLAPAPSGVKG